MDRRKFIRNSVAGAAGMTMIPLHSMESHHHKLKEANIRHVYKEYRGANETFYWQEHIKDSSLFFNQLL